MEGIRLQKAIAQAGLMSRRAAEESIREGRVVVNGKVVTEMGVRVSPERDEIEVDRKRIFLREAKAYFLLYKPRGCVTTAIDPRGRKTVLDFLPEREVRVFPVGRLDYDAEGLLILTNDGMLAHRLQHPRYGIAKVYEVKVKGHPGDEALKRLRTGVILEEGRTAPAEVETIRRAQDNTWLRIVLHQGWNRQIKRMGDAVGHPVLKIKRSGYGPLRLGGLKPGEFRPLVAREVELLHKMVNLEESRERRS
jgi:23S rRNA pseudouridine2605 synthase